MINLDLNLKPVLLSFSSTFGTQATTVMLPSADLPHSHACYASTAQLNLLFVNNRLCAFSLGFVLAGSSASGPPLLGQVMAQPLNDVDQQTGWAGTLVKRATLVGRMRCPLCCSNLTKSTIFRVAKVVVFAQTRRLYRSRQSFRFSIRIGETVHKSHAQY